MVRVRFAPSPTGSVHIGSLRTALYNYLFARKNKGIFILRIEDTDRERLVKGATENLIEALKWAGLNPDEGPEQGGAFAPYYQSQRTKMYLKYCNELVDKGGAYYAFDTPQEIEEMRTRFRQQGLSNFKYDVNTRQEMRNSLTMSPEQVQKKIDAGEQHVVRLLVPPGRQFQVDDLIRGQVVFDSREMDDQVLLKSDGFPTYHLANVVDDHLMQISHVIRGEEWLSSVPKHLLLYEYFGWQPPQMAHLPLIFNPDGSKMSKRDSVGAKELPPGKVDPDVATYIRDGYEKDAIINHIALLGWNPGEGDERQIFTFAELIDEFSLERVNKSAAIFDVKKLNWINKEHISHRSAADLAEQVKPLLQQAGFSPVQPAYLLQIVNLVKDRLHRIADFPQIASYFFQEPEQFDASALKKNWRPEIEKILVEFSAEIAKLEPFTAAEIEGILRNTAQQLQINAGKLIHPLRLALTGVSVGPGLFELMEVLGKEAVIRRIRKAAAAFPILVQQS